MPRGGDYVGVPQPVPGVLAFRSWSDAQAPGMFLVNVLYIYSELVYWNISSQLVYWIFLVNWYKYIASQLCDA